MKKLLLALIILVMAAIFAASYAVRQAPEWLRAALEGSLGKSVSIQSIDFQFPRAFVLSGVTIAEKDGPFAGEPEFTADTVRLTAVPSARSGKFVIDAIEVSEATVIVRRFGGRLYHAFSSSPNPPGLDPEAIQPDVVPRGEVSGQTRTLSISFLRLLNGRFQFVDYDAAEQGFVFDCEAIQARVSEFQVPATSRNTSYTIEGRLLQGRDEKPATFSVSGTTAFATLDSEARVELKNLHLPYFAPYALSITPAAIEEGYLDLRVQALIRDRELTADAELAFTSLYFHSLEGDNQLFGLSATEIVDFHKDSSGRLRIPVSIRWNTRERNIRLRDIIRRSIETSLKRTVFGNMGAMLEAAIVRIGQKGLDAPEKASETVLKKIKDFLKY